MDRNSIIRLFGLIQGLTEAMEREMADSVLEVSLAANKQTVQELIQGDGGMYEALMEIMEPQLVLRDEAKLEEGLRKGIQKGIQQGMQRGLQKGEYKTLYDLVCDHLITMESAAARKNLTTDEFLMKLRELNII